LILAILLSVFVLGLCATAAMADVLMFPWLVKSNSVITMLSVVNTSDKNSSCTGSQQLHYQYYVKVPDLTSSCVGSSFTRDTSVNDLVTFDASGTVGGGGALFNDQPPHNANVTYTPNQFDMPSSPNPARAFLLVDNNLGDCSENEDYASLYGEALVIQLDQGAAWGYVAYNGTGGGPFGPAAKPYSLNDGTDLQGEVMRSPRYFDDASDGDELETTPVVLLPFGTGPGSLFKTKIFVTPVNYSLWEYGSGPGADTRDSNSRIQFCVDPRPTPDVFPINSTCPALGIGFLSKDSCQKNSDPTCQHPGIFDNDEGIMDGSIPVDVVCTAAIALWDGSTQLLTQQQLDYMTDQPGSQTWTYVRSMVGSFFASSGLGTRDVRTQSDSIIGKLEYQDSTAGLTISGTTIGGAINDFKWIRNSGSQVCDPHINVTDGSEWVCGQGCCDWDLSRGINKIIQDDGFGDEI